MDDLFPQLTRDEWIETAVAVLVVALAVTLALLLSTLARRFIHAFTHATESRLDDRLAEAVRRPLVMLVITWSVAAGVRSLSYLDDEERWVTLTAAVITIIVVSSAIRTFVIALLEWQVSRPGVTGARLHPGSLPLIRRGFTILVFAIALLIILDQLGVAISPLLAGLGIGGLAVALALQPLLANVFASSYMLSDSSIRIGDFVEVAGGPVGIVDDIGWRATRIRSFDNNVVILPNSVLADSTVTNFTLTTTQADARVVVGVAYEEDLGRVERICREVLTTLRDEWPTTIKTHEPVVLYQGFGDSNIDILLKCRADSWVASFDLKHEMVKRIHARFRDEGIVINYPARRLFLQGDDVSGLAALSTNNGHAEGRVER